MLYTCIYTPVVYLRKGIVYIEKRIERETINAVLLGRGKTKSADHLSVYTQDTDQKKKKKICRYILNASYFCIGLTIKIKKGGRKEE